MKNLLVAFIMALFFIGCGSPDLPNYKINKSDAVGYIIKTNENMIHTHYGTTVFSNFEKKYPKLVKKEDVEKLLIENVNAKLVDLSSYNYDKLDKLIIEKSGKWLVSDRNLYNELIRKYKIKAIIIVSESSGGIYMHPTYFSSRSSGIMSRSFLGMNAYYSISGFDFKLNLLTPKGRTNIRNNLSASLMSSNTNSSFQKESGFINPENYKSLNEKEIISAKKSILEITKVNIVKINEYLENK